MASVLPSEHIKDLLVTKGYRYKGTNPTSLDWDIWIGRQPSTPDRSITLYDSGGLPSNPRWQLDYPSVQVRVRGDTSDYIVAGQLARKLRTQLVGQESYTAPGGDRIVHINAIGDVTFLGWGEQTRPEFVFNLQMIVEPVASVDDNRDPL